MATGRVKMFNDDRGFGFIAVDEAAVMSSCISGMCPVVAWKRAIA